MKSLLIAVCVFALVYGYPKKNGNTKISNGEFAKEGEFPYQVALAQEGRFICGGSIITENLILTAAHCLDDIEDVNDLKVLAGVINLFDSSTQIRDVLAINSYKSDRGIGFVILSEPLILSEKVQVIEVDNEKVPLGSVVTVTGWGQDAKDEYKYDLKKVNITIVECPEKVTEPILCIDSYSGVCLGDSGGPLTYNGKQVGIVSSGKCSYDRFTDLHLYYSWVQSFINFFQCILASNL